MMKNIGEVDGLWTSNVVYVGAACHPPTKSNRRC